MSRNPEKNAEVRESRKKQILDAALTVYIRFGYHGTDMETVAEEARLAKGLLYYYYKTKRELFTELYTWMFDEAFSFSSAVLEKTDGMDPIEQLMLYCYAMFGANKCDFRFMQFNIRVPFDAYAVFGPDGWQEGAKKSDLHRKALTSIIERGTQKGLFKCSNPSNAANGFWSVFVANAFEYSKLMVGNSALHNDSIQILRDVVRFGFQGLGVDFDIWNSCLEKVVTENHNGGIFNEGF